MLARRRSIESHTQNVLRDQDEKIDSETTILKQAIIVGLGEKDQKKAG